MLINVRSFHSSNTLVAFHLSRDTKAHNQNTDISAYGLLVNIVQLLTDIQFLGILTAIKIHEHISFKCCIKYEFSPLGIFV